MEDFRFANCGLRIEPAAVPLRHLSLMAKLSKTNRTIWGLWLVNCWLAAVLVFFIYSRVANSGLLHRRGAGRLAQAASLANAPVVVHTEDTPPRRP